MTFNCLTGDDVIVLRAQDRKSRRRTSIGDELSQPACTPERPLSGSSPSPLIRYILARQSYY